MLAKSIDYWIVDCKMLLQSGLTLAEKLLNASTRNIDKNTSGLAKTEGLEEECEEESGKYYVSHSICFIF